MHLLRTVPGGFVDDSEGVVRVDQQPAPIVILSSADTTLSLLAGVMPELGDDFPAVRLTNVSFLRQPASVDFYVDDVLAHARVIIVDHLGGQSYWPYGIERLVALAQARGGPQLVMFSGDLQEDPHLQALSTADPVFCHQLWRYLREGGRQNARHFMLSIAREVFAMPVQPEPVRVLPAATLYWPGGELATLAEVRGHWQAGAPVVALLFYKAHLQAANLASFDALIQSLRERGLNPLPLAITSLKDAFSLEILRQLCAEVQADLVLNTTAFAAASPGAETTFVLAGDAPVLQLITCSANRESWAGNDHGLRARDIAMHVALPEIDGRLITRTISFKGAAYYCERTQVDVVSYQPDHERIAFVVELARRWAVLRHKPNADKRLALVLANYPLSEGRIGNGVGLDVPASVVGMLAMLVAQGYALDSLPDDGDALMRQLTRGVTNDPVQRPLRPAWQSLSMADYRDELARWPQAAREAILQRWGEPEDDPTVRSGRFMIAGWRCGKVFVGIQPARSHDPADYASYHDAELVPPHAYLAFYIWLRKSFAVDALVHVGKHGNLEWLPGKSVALADSCWPELALGPLPHLYPFIVNDPGEGAQAKRRAQAVIIDHLMPPLTRAENYGPLQDLEREVDEYYEAVIVDPRRATLLRKGILKRIVEHDLHRELSLEAPADSEGEDALLTSLDAYLCELKEAQIRDGLHIFGQSPTGRQRRDTLMALLRYPVGDGRGANSGLTQALVRDLQLEAWIDPCAADWAKPWIGPRPEALQRQDTAPWRHLGDTRERLESLALSLLDQALEGRWPESKVWPHTVQVLQRLQQDVAPRLDACGAEELRQLQRGLEGRFVPPGPSGAPSRGRPDVLPTGRNFYSLDTRSVPTQAAWTLGQRSAHQLIERHLQDHGDYPQAIGLSVWGTATMRTGGDDLAQAMALLGVRPVWAPGSHRVTDFEIMPIEALDRPRIDVTLRVSGFFRDAFPAAMHLFDAAVQAVAEQDEPDDLNPVRARILRERDSLAATGMSLEEARRQAGWRVFSSRPGHYGTGLQELIDRRHWQDDADLAGAYRDWGGHAYAARTEGEAAPEAFGRRLAEIDLVVQNQDNREHDLLDSNDYYQFQGGMAVAARHLGGRQPAIYHADHSNPEVPRVRSLREEVARVLRSRVVNPKWMDGVKRHGYKGAAEMAATVDYLFGYDATARVVEDYQYAMVGAAYLDDAATRDFLREHNPQALSDICERLLEAVARGLWQQPGEQAERIERYLLDNENHIEGRNA
ncbi:cobaltochelatase subunit CobN [Frateuria aurantia]|uniref:Cobaltochelatase subunit CobN n=1 Tax=Frateuria aurantia (strain ATCC 33424 / DSM 6220 / KCTC 2777 / LMG 1558 / NBRC 3245 / NCIMB 13370) TaxID=767434 RepID=H8L507_FRAAD|nr:cobaltochelatase subunit CobN [Frateuria aurantia]AFC85721.1 cobaltochelatase, CobN subunit [Frateuria aurantia DSM 6220]